MDLLELLVRIVLALVILAFVFGVIALMRTQGEGRHRD